MNEEKKTSKRVEKPIVYHGSIPCQAMLKKNKHQQCTNHAYYEENGSYLCGQHSNEKKRTLLPMDKDVKKRRLDQLSLHQISVKESAEMNRMNGIGGKIKCYKMRMMKDVPLVNGWKNVFPNNKHQNRMDGFGCAELSPMQLGPVIHRQPSNNIPSISFTIENYHQSNKVYPNEVKGEEILPIFYERRKSFYKDKVPHRHKFDDETMNEMRKKIPNLLNRNAPLFSVHETLNGEERRFSYVQSRYFYCKAYERLAKEKDSYQNLRDMLRNGENLIICGYDARDIEGQDLDAVYSDPKHAFGHELALFSLLTIENEVDYPWNRYRRNNPDIYENIAFML